MEMMDQKHVSYIHRGSNIFGIPSKYIIVYPISQHILKPLSSKRHAEA